jgi:hypothetical protein
MEEVRREDAHSFQGNVPFFGFKYVTFSFITEELSHLAQIRSATAFARGGCAFSKHMGYRISRPKQTGQSRQNCTARFA